MNRCGILIILRILSYYLRILFQNWNFDYQAY